MHRALHGLSPDRFWEAVDHLVATSRLVIDRPKGSRHPRIPEAVYPLDYGYLDGTTSGDGDGIDVWLGSLRPATAAAAVCTIDGRKRDAEIKLLLGCTPDEEAEILEFLNTGNMAAILIWRPAGPQAPATRALP